MTTRGNVLVVEDDSATRELFVYALELAGWHVRSAADGLSGLRILDVFNPDVIVLDMRLPAADGVSVLDHLTARSVRAPVIAVSGYDDAIETARAHPLVLAMIRKPFEPQELVRTVAKAKQFLATS
jgi:DNA-binding response OmpR family regulator